MLYLEKEGKGYIPFLELSVEKGEFPEKTLFLGTLDRINCFAAEVSEDFSLPADGEGRYVFKGLRELYPELGDEYFSLAGRALQLLNWHNNWCFCPSCGSHLADSDRERAKLCQSCSSVYYPVISPAVIVAVTKGDRLLLARNSRYRNVKRYTILAGFVEPGESLEETVAREIEEEVDIKVKNIEYYGSQSWPFPHSLMIGFTAEYESGEIRVDGDEIVDAGWFTRDSLPEIPLSGSISRVLIEAFRKGSIGS